VSEPALRLQCGGVSRERRRESQVGYETGRDRAALSVSRWSSDEMCAVLYYLVCRCDQSQLYILHTSLESVPHRDLQLSSSVGVASGLELRPVSTPLSREVRVRLRKSRRPQNQRLYRAQSVVLHEELPIRSLTPSPITPHIRQTPLLPSLPPSPSALLTPLPPSTHPPTPTPITRTPRRHLLTTPLPHELLTSDHDSFIRGGECQNVQLSPDATHFLTWFSSLTAGWQQQEVLHMLISGLDVNQLYLLSAILLSRKFRDPVGCLPEPLALHLLSYLPPKDLLRNCTTVHTPHTRIHTRLHKPFTPIGQDIVSLFQRCKNCF
jgi:hypothetical protein